LAARDRYNAILLPDSPLPAESEDLTRSLHSGPYEFDADTSRFETHHVLARALSEQLRQKFNLDVCSMFDDLGELVQPLLAFHLQRQVVQSNISPPVERLNIS
jgi:hypothetical protein